MRYEIEQKIRRVIGEGSARVAGPALDAAPLYEVTAEYEVAAGTTNAQYNSSAMMPCQRGQAGRPPLAKTAPLCSAQLLTPRSTKHSRLLTSLGSDVIPYFWPQKEVECEA